MKRKSVFLLGAILAGSALVGGTFAAWAVTDNASPIDVKITPGTISTGNTTYVTLEYGDRELINVEGLQPDDVLGPYNLGLKATTGDASAFAYGQLEVTLSEEKEADTLIDYVTVTVKNESDGTIATLDSSHTSYKGIPYASMTSGTAKNVKFYVALSGSAREVYSTIKTQKLNLRVDWNLADGQETTSSRAIYFENHGSWANVNAYAFGASGEAKAWPGIKMTQVSGAIYSVEVDAIYDKIIFNDGGSNQTDDLTINNTYPYYHWDSSLETPAYAWAAAPDISNVSYYLVGTPNSWNITGAQQFAASTHQATIAGNNVKFDYQVLNVSVNSGDEYKVVSSLNEWFYKQGDSGNWRYEGETKTFNFYLKIAGFTGDDAATYYLHAEEVA